MLQGQAQTRKWLPAGHPRADAAPRGELCPARQVRRKLIVDGRLNAEVVGQSALHLAEIFGLQVGHSQALQATPRLADSIIVWALVGHGSIAHLQGQLPCTAQSPMGPILPGQAAVCLSSCLVWFPPMHAFPPPPPPPSLPHRQVPEWTRIIIAEAEVIGKEEALSQEKLCPVRGSASQAAPGCLAAGSQAQLACREAQEARGGAAAETRVTGAAAASWQ